MLRLLVASVGAVVALFPMVALMFLLTHNIDFSWAAAMVLSLIGVPVLILNVWHAPTSKDTSRTKAHRVTELADPELGTLRWSEDDNNWEANVTVGDSTIGFLIGGDSEPSEALLSHARDITRNLPDFLSMVSAFLSAEAAKKDMSDFSDEIMQLQIEHVCLFWPNRPNDGMIFFQAEENYPGWRCDYVNRIPRSLGFDS